MNDRLYNQIEEAVRLIESGAETLESCATRYGRDWETMRGQVRTNLLLLSAAEQHNHQTATLFNREAVRERLQAQIRRSLSENLYTTTAAQTTPTADSGLPPARPVIMPPRRRSWLDEFLSAPGAAFRLKITGAVAVFLLFCALTAWGVEASGPGDLFYGPKLSLEEATQAFAFSPDTKTDARLAYAERRFQDVQAAINQGKESNLEQAVVSYEKAVNESLNTTSSSKKREAELRALRQLETLQNAQPGRHPALANMIRRLQVKLGLSDDIDNQPLPTVTTKPEQTKRTGSVTPASNSGQTQTEPTKASPSRTVAPGVLPTETPRPVTTAPVQRENINPNPVENPANTPTPKQPGSTAGE